MVIPVDNGLKESARFVAGMQVHQDMAYLGNEVDIKHNNNKFYRGQVIEQGGRFYAWTRWGRVGEKGQDKLEGPSTAAAAISAFQKKFKDKTGNEWQGREANYAPKPDKYTVIYEAVAGKSQTAKLVGAQVSFAPVQLQPELVDFVSFVTDNDMFQEQLQNMGVDTTKMPLGDISQRTVESGFAALLAIEECLKSGKRSDLERLCSVFYTYIPHAFGRSKPPLLSLGDIAAKKIMLNVIGDVGIAVSGQKAAEASTSSPGTLEPAPIDVKYASLGCALSVVDPASDAFKMMATYTANTQGSRRCSLVEAYAVSRPDHFDQHAGMENRRLLWHGTNVAVVAAILKTGLRIMPHAGGRVGAGIYLASENGKSAGYVTAHGHFGVMFLCEAALGKQFLISHDGEVGHSDRDPVSARGCDSVLAVGRTEPDASADITVKMDGKAVTVPQGTVKPNPLPEAQSSSYSQSEYLVYRESQCRIRYVLKMKFETSGGSWH